MKLHILSFIIQLHFHTQWSIFILFYFIFYFFSSGVFFKHRSFPSSWMALLGSCSVSGTVVHVPHLSQCVSISNHRRISGRSVSNWQLSWSYGNRGNARWRVILSLKEGLQLWSMSFWRVLTSKIPGKVWGSGGRVGIDRFSECDSAGVGGKQGPTL